MGGGRYFAETLGGGVRDAHEEGEEDVVGEEGGAAGAEERGASR